MVHKVHINFVQKGNISLFEWEFVLFEEEAGVSPLSMSVYFIPTSSVTEYSYESIKRENVLSIICTNSESRIFCSFMWMNWTSYDGISMFFLCLFLPTFIP